MLKDGAMNVSGTDDSFGGSGDPPPNGSGRDAVTDPSHTPLPTVAVILAGGTGVRVGLKLPKQLLKISGKPIIQHTLEVFSRSPLIDEIIVMMTPGHLESVEKIVANNGLTKVTRVLAGGSSRSETTRLALEAIGGTECNVLLHDAVRPLVDQRIITDCVRALTRYEAIDVAIPSADTIITVDDVARDDSSTATAESGADVDEVITDIPSRDRLRRGQTPQGFRVSTLRAAYEAAEADPDFTATDDCGVVRRYLPHVPIYVVPGAEHNMKITHPVDVYLADKLFQLAAHRQPPHLSEAVYRDRIAGRTAVIFGGSYGIGAAIGEMLTGYGATVLSFSRSATGTYVENPEHVAAALLRAQQETGRVDFVVNTAGVLRTGALVDTDDAGIDEVLKVNYLAPVQIARAALPYLQRTHGSLLYFTSSSYTRGRAGYSLYSSTKAAVVNLTQALADEWSEVGVRVNCVNPERTATPMRVKAFGEEPADTLLSANEVARTAVDVLIDDTTGLIIDVRRAPGGHTLSEERSPEQDPITAAAAEAEEDAAAEAIHG